MNRRLVTIVLHWSTLVLLLLLLASGTENVALAWAFAILGLALVATALLYGLMNGPGPKLDGMLRTAHPWMNRAMYVLLGWAAVVVLFHRLGISVPGPAPRSLLIILLGAGLLHGVFHLWRTTALNDGALRRMLP